MKFSQNCEMHMFKTFKITIESIIKAFNVVPPLPPSLFLTFLQGQREINLVKCIPMHTIDIHNYLKKINKKKTSFFHTVRIVYIIYT